MTGLYLPRYEYIEMLHINPLERDDIMHGMHIIVINGNNKKVMAEGIVIEFDDNHIVLRTRDGKRISNLTDGWGLPPKPIVGNKNSYVAYDTNCFFALKATVINRLRFKVRSMR